LGPASMLLKAAQSPARFSRFVGSASRLAHDADISPSFPWLGFASLIATTTALSSSPPRSSLRLALHSPRCGCVVLPCPMVRGGKVVGRPRVAHISCSSVSLAHGCCWSSSSSSSSRRAGAAAGCCICLPRPGPMVDAASSSQVIACFLFGSASSYPSPKQGEILKCCLHLARFWRSKCS
jgi:hypothetical protein